MIILPAGMSEKVKNVQGKDRYTKLLLHMDGSNMGTTFTDECGHAVTNHNNAYTTTSQKKFGTAGGNFAASGSAYLSLSSADFIPGSSDFEIDFWFKLASNTATQYLFGKGSGYVDYYARYRGSGNNDFEFCVKNASDTWSSIYTKNFSHTLTDTSDFHHFKAGRQGSNIYVLVDNVEWGSASITGAVKNTSNDFYIGYTSSDFTGYMDEFRLSIGTFRDNHLPACAYY